MARNGPIRWGILGCGDVTERKSGPAFSKVPDSTIAAVMRRDGAKAADYAKRHGVPRWFDDADALIECEHVDAVYVATPPGSHMDYALRVAAAGKPCYVEKPMARSASECAAMVDAFAAKNLPLFVAFYRRKLPRFEAVSCLLQRGEIGRVRSMDYRFASGQPWEGWRFDAKAAGGGLFLDLASHGLDLFDRLLGPLGDVRGDATGKPGEVESAVDVEGHFPGDVTFRGRWEFVPGGPHVDDVVITGDGGTIRFAVLHEKPITIATAGGGVHELTIPHPEHVQQPLIASIVDDLLGRGVCPSTGVSAMRTSVVMDRVLDGYYGGRSDEFWNHPERWGG